MGTSVEGETRTGSFILLGSGETAPAVQRVYREFFDYVGERPDIAILETPAGFEPNSDHVAGDIARFVEARLPNFRPRTCVLPARRRDGEQSTNNPDLLQRLLTANVVLTGPGSPTYAIRHLKGSLCWDYLRICNRQGQHLFLSSAATVACGAVALPVYEIYKVGQDLFWQDGLNLFGDFGLRLTVIPHWNNTSGGASLDTRRCYMGLDRFSRLLDLLPTDPPVTILGIDENTAAHVKPRDGVLTVLGRGCVTLLRGGEEEVFEPGSSVELDQLGDWQVPAAAQGIREDRYQAAIEERNSLLAESASPPEPPPAVAALLDERSKARADKSWELSDQLRERIRECGWEVRDSPQGQVALPKG